MTAAPIASRRHLTIVLVIAGVIALAGMQQASALAGAKPASRAVPYLIAIALQLAWARYIQMGMRRYGRSVREFFADATGLRGAAIDAVAVVIGFVFARFAAIEIRAWLSGPPANTAFLLPHGQVESILWVALSVAAGVCEEIVFRAYLQRQFAALTGNVALGILLQALVFGVSHGYQGPVSILSTGGYGLVLGLIAWQRGNIRACAVIHAATDIVGGLLRA